MLDVSNFKDGYYIDNDGIEQSHAQFGYTTDFTPVVAGETYTLSGNVGNSSNAYSAIYCYNANQEFVDRLGFNTTAVPYTFTVPEGVTSVHIQYFIAANLSTVMLEKGSTATAYEPYENICPIEGWNGIEVTRCGKNIIDGNEWQ